MAMLDYSMMIDETLPFHYTPQTKQNSGLKKDLTDAINAWVPTGHTKQLFMVFFDSKGLFYRHIIPRGITINTAYIVKVLGTFIHFLKKKRPVMAVQEVFFNWETAPIQADAIVEN